MKNHLYLLLLFAITSGFSQSNSLHIVTKIGLPEFRSTKSEIDHLSSIGRSYTFGFEFNKFTNPNKYVSGGYGFLNQINRYTIPAQSLSTSNVTNEFIINTFDILLPVKLQGHFGNWSIFGSFVPTYHFNAKIIKKSIYLSQDTGDPIMVSEQDFDFCNPLVEQCSRGFPFFKNFEFQYNLGVQYQINRFSLFCEFSEYFRTKIFNQGSGSTNRTFGVNRINLDLGSIRRSFSFGTSFKIY